MDYVLVVSGLILLVFGGDWLVKSAVELALRLKISVLVVSMTVVSFGTSAPELLVSLQAATQGYTDISFGNVIGSNIANITLILGATAIFYPIFVNRQSYRIDWGVMMFVTLLLLIFLLNSKLEFWESAVFVVLLIAYNIFHIRYSKITEANNEEVPSRPRKKLVYTLVLFAAGIAGLKFGSDILVKGAVNLAEKWGVSERIIGLTVISIGTSLPELAASLIASIKGEQDVSMGNLIGSNIFNILAVLGISGLFVELPVQSSQLLTFDFPWLLGNSVVLFLFMAIVKKGVVNRWQGLVLLVGYIAYILILIM